MKFSGPKVCYPTNKNNHTLPVYYILYRHSTTQFASLHHLMYLYSCMGETFEIFPPTGDILKISQRQWVVILPKPWCLGVKMTPTPGWVIPCLGRYL